MFFIWGIEKEAEIYCSSVKITIKKKQSDDLEEQLNQMADEMCSKGWESLPRSMVVASLVRNVEEEVSSMGWSLTDEDGVSWFLGLLCKSFVRSMRFRQESFDKLFTECFIAYFTKHQNDDVKMPNKSIVESLQNGDNNPDDGELKFESTDHIRFQNDIDVSGHNYGCHRQIEIKKNINGGIGYTVTIYNMDGSHPLWGNNVQMAPKQMKIIKNENNVVSLIGFGTDFMGTNFSDYGIDIYFYDNNIQKIVLRMIDRNTRIEYLK